MKYIVFLALLFATSTFAQDKLNTSEMEKSAGLFTTFYDETKDKIYLEVEHLDSSFIYVSSLSQGLGNNDLFLDRGQLGDTRVVKFLKAGQKILLVQPNQRYRALTDNELEKKSVEEAFAKSVLYGFEIAEKTETGYLIDLTSFLLRDTHGVGQVLNDMKEGNYNLDLSRSALNLERTKSFPENVDFDVVITLKGNPTGRKVRSVTPDAKYVTTYQHHSFVKLPDDDFKPRIAHPNSGSITISFMDYSSEIGEPMEVKYSWRHRLEKKDPQAERSEAVEPIVYYLDNGTPEPIRSALMEGAGWWNQAFEAIGYIDAFQVKILPDTVDPLDVRYNVIQWVHRSTRGWSYGGGVVDPRTGEIIKGHVSLGSLRVRQDYKIARALTASANEDDMLEFALARIRQLGAHEVGHTLGFAHNFAASLNDRASVMDYPHPWVKVEQGNVDISNAYDTGIGEWDKVTVAYSYSEIQGDEETGLKKIIEDAMSKGFRYISDSDARSIGGSNVFGHLWDNGPFLVEELKNVVEVRSHAIENFSDKMLKDGESYAELEDLFVLLYFYHRYQVEAVIKNVGGRVYNLSLKGETDGPGEPLDAMAQKNALQEVLKTIQPEFLAIPAEKLELFPDRGGWQGRDRESFQTLTGPTFDPLSAGKAATDFVLERLLHPERINRLVSQSALDPDQLSLELMLDELIYFTWDNKPSDVFEAELQVVINESVLRHLMRLAQSKDVYPQVRAAVNKRIMLYKGKLKDTKKMSAMDLEMVRIIDNYFEHPTAEVPLRTTGVPDGSPIGSHSCEGGH